MNIPQPSPRTRRENYRQKQSKDNSPTLEAELFDAKRVVRDLTLKIEESKSRTKELQRKPKWCEQESPETSEVMTELQHMKQELGKVKIDMARVLKEKRYAERASKLSNSKSYTLSASMELIKKEMQELCEEQAIVELARLEAVKECESMEAPRKEEVNGYRNQLQVTLSDINLIESELNMAKEMDAIKGSLLNTIKEELEAAKRELASIKGEGFNFMASMDVIRDELNRVRDETARLQKEEERRDLTVQKLNSKILRENAKLEALTAAETKSNTVASNLSITLEQLRAESKITKNEKDLIDVEIENTKGEIDKTESEIQLKEERLEAAMEELKAIKSSESKALRKLRNVINTKVEARDLASMNSSTITITSFEYGYLTGKAGGAAELADMKISAAQAWVEALKANEREILMNVEMTERKINELIVEAEKEKEVEEEAEGEEYGRSSAEFPAKIGEKVVASRRRSVYRVGSKRGKLQKLPSSARYSSKSRSLRREK